MGKRIKDSTRVSKMFKVKDWKEERVSLINDIIENRHNSGLWKQVFKYFKD